jgi:hypothetical protein
MQAEFHLRKTSRLRLYICMAASLIVSLFLFIGVYDAMTCSQCQIPSNAWVYLSTPFLVGAWAVVTCWYMAVTKIKMDESGISFQTFGLKIQTPWENVVRVARRPSIFRLPRYEFVLRHEVEGEIDRYTPIFDKTARTRIPISPFAYWPDPEMLPILERFAPQVMEDWRRNSLRP